MKTGVSGFRLGAGPGVKEVLGAAGFKTSPERQA